VPGTEVFWKRKSSLKIIVTEVKIRDFLPGVTVP